MKNLTKAILQVMSEVEGIDKTLNVGTGNSSYKGVADKDVKQVIGKSMQKNGLVILPIAVEPKATLSEWDQEETWNGKTQVKHKTSVFTEVYTKYMLIHAESGESMEVAGYGHGVDSQDKSAGKATTYALKNTLLYMFLVPTGSIDDTDNTHSNDLPAKKVSVPKKVESVTELQLKTIRELIAKRGRTESEVLKIGKLESLESLDTIRAGKLVTFISKLPEATLH